MKTGLLSLTLLASSLLPLTAGAQQTRILNADKHNEYGLVYTLPTTALRIEVTARHDAFRAGDYAQYAKRYVGTDRVISKDNDTWTITSVKVTPYGVPDPEQRYLMQLKPGATTYIGVSDDGMLLSINCEPKEPAALPQAAEDTRLPDFNSREYLQYVNEDFLSSQSSVKRAQMLAESLMEVREAKVSLTRGTAETMPTDGRQLELMLNSLAHQEEVITQAFTGWKGSETATRTFTYQPGEDDEAILFRFSDFAGFVDSDDLRGAAVKIGVKVKQKGELPVDAKGVEKVIPKDAVIYALPGLAEIRVTMEGQNLWREDLQMPQYGTVFGLSPTLFTDKKAPSAATFDPVTGALLSISSNF